MTEYYYEKLSLTGKNYYRQVVRAAEAWKSSVSSSPLLSEKDFRAAVQAVNYDHPELFHVNFQSQAFSRDMRGFTLQLRYLYPQTVAQIVKSKIDAAVSSILNAAKPSAGKPRYIQYRFLHNQFLKLVRYDYAALANPSSNLEAYTIAGVFNNHSAVCEGIAKAFKYLCDKSGLYCTLIIGQSIFAQTGTKVEHAWNLVEVDDGLAHIDVTWDINATTASSFNRYDYFCIADEDVKADHFYSGYPAALSSKFNYFTANRALISGFKALEVFLKTKLSSGCKDLYFKLRKSEKLTKAIIPRITETVEKTAAAVYANGYSLSAVFNEEQYVFYYRVVGM